MIRVDLAALAAAGLLALAMTGCKEEVPDETLPPPAMEQIEEPTSPVEPPGPAEKGAVVSVGKASLRETADPKGKWTTTLMRGEKVVLLDDGAPQGDFLHVKLSDGTEGFLVEKSVLVGDVEEVVVLEERPLHQRPDDAAPRLGAIQIGTLLFITKSQDQWIEVRLPKGRTGWMLADQVVRDADELDAARALFRYELLKDAKRKEQQEEAKQILAEAISRHPDSKVLAAKGLVAEVLSVEAAHSPTPVAGEPTPGVKPTAPAPAPAPAPVPAPTPTPASQPTP